MKAYSAAKCKLPSVQPEYITANLLFGIGLKSSLKVNQLKMFSTIIAVDKVRNIEARSIFKIFLYETFIKNNTQRQIDNYATYILCT